MTISLNLWWASYTLFVVVALSWAIVERKDERKRGDYDFMFWIPAAFRLGAAVISSLILAIILLIARV